MIQWIRVAIFLLNKQRFAQPSTHFFVTVKYGMPVLWWPSLILYQKMMDQFNVGIQNECYGVVACSHLLANEPPHALSVDCQNPQYW